MAVAVDHELATTPTQPDVGRPDAQPSSQEPRDIAPERRPWLAPITPRRIAGLGAAWTLVTVVGIGLVVYGVGPMLEQRDQRHLLHDYRTDIGHASEAAFGLHGAEEVKDAPAVGDPVAIVEIDAIDFRQVVVEGVGPQQTRRGPGHVPGTAGSGQPGNSAIVGRKTGFGGSFSQLDELERGDEIFVTTTQGQSLYKVTTVDTRGVSRGDDKVYGPSDNDRLTLVTSNSMAPWGTSSAVVVVAKLDTIAFEPTPQGGRVEGQDGRGRDGSALAPMLLAVLGYACAAAATVLLYRRLRPRSAYLMSAPLLVVATVLVGEASARLLPAWF